MSRLKRKEKNIFYFFRHHDRTQYTVELIHLNISVLSTIMKTCSKFEIGLI